jgi:hypothetical protein
MPSNSVLHPNLPLERSLSRRSAAETEIDVAGFPAHTRRMAKKAAAIGGTSSTSPKSEKAAEKSGTRVTRPSALLDTRVVYCGDNLEQLAKLPDNALRVFINERFYRNGV